MNTDEIYLGAIKRAKAELKRRVMISILSGFVWGILLALIHTFGGSWRLGLAAAWLIGWAIVCAVIMRWMISARESLEKAEEEWEQKLWSHGLLR